MVQHISIYLIRAYRTGRSSRFKGVLLLEMGTKRCDVMVFIAVRAWEFRSDLVLHLELINSTPIRRLKRVIMKLGGVVPLGSRKAGDPQIRIHSSGEVIDLLRLID
jgi:hypothetical protein